VRCAYPSYGMASPNLPLEMWEIIDIMWRVVIPCGISPWACCALGQWAFLGPTRVGRPSRVASKYINTPESYKKIKAKKEEKNFKTWRWQKAFPLSHLEVGVQPPQKTFLGTTPWEFLGVVWATSNLSEVAQQHVRYKWILLTRTF
jgi:hypothetical protein